MALIAAALIISLGLVGAAHAARIIGTPGKDRIVGTAKNDTLLGRGGNDTLLGRGGADTINGGRGNDRLNGGRGNDRLNGGPGRDRLNGGPGNDRIDARGNGVDTITCGPGRDTVIADRSDRIARDCENVRLPAPPPPPPVQPPAPPPPPPAPPPPPPPPPVQPPAPPPPPPAPPPPPPPPPVQPPAPPPPPPAPPPPPPPPPVQPPAPPPPPPAPPPPPPPPPTPPPPTTPGQWSDPAGDRPSWAPDVTTVRVGDDGSGRITFRLDIPNFEKLAEGVLVNILLDVDQNPATGYTEGGGEGDEYLIVVDGGPEAYLNRWDGAAWEWLDSPVAVEWRFGVTVTIDLAEIGNPRAFNFWAGAWGDNPDGSGSSGDVVPNTGTWNYRVGTATAVPTGAFVIEYVPSDDPETQGRIDWIDESNRLDLLAAYLNATYALPEDIHVYVEEGTFGPAYFPNLRAITMPPEFLDTILYLFRGWWDDPEDVSGAAIGAFAWVFLHEVGHALVDVLGLPAVGLEEDAADQFATVFATSLESPWQAYHGAVLFRALGQNRGAPGAGDYWDEHALHEQRNTNILCWLYGYDPFKFVHVPTRFPESADRLERCGAEYQQVKSAWTALLAPYSNA